MNSMSDIRLHLIAKKPYLATAVLNLKFVEKPGLGTFACSAGWVMYYDPALTWEIEQAAAALEHEIWHLLRQHHERCDCVDAPNVLNKDELWNIAGDAEINDDLVGLPGTPVTPQLIGSRDGLTAEEYFDHIMKTAKKQKVPQPNCGSSARKGKQPWEDAESGEDRSIIDSNIRKTTAEAIRKMGRGTVPGNLERWADLTLKPPTIPWKQLFQKALRKSLGFCTGYDRMNFSRPSRRQIPEMVTPSWRAEKPKVAIIVDTSGSISDKQFTDAVMLVKQAASNLQAAVTMLACDAAVHFVGRVMTALPRVSGGGGGTDMRVGIQEALKHRSDIIIVITDGYTPWSDRPEKVPVIVLVPTGAPQTPDFYVRVEVKEEE